MSSEETNAPDNDAPSVDPSAETPEVSVDGLDAVLSPEEQELLTLRVERDDYLATLQRLQADFDNYRRRSVRDQETAAERAGEKVVMRLLPVLDTFEMALTHEVSAEGMAKLHDSLLSALEAEGLERLAPIDEPFDPSVADAVVHEEGDDSSAAPVVSEVLRAGYRWKSKVVRAAMVKVKG
jgi:molecular chaperone GrpE